MSTYLVIYILLGHLWVPTPLADINIKVPVFNMESQDVCEWAKEYVQEQIGPLLQRKDGRAIILRGECVPENAIIGPFQEA